MISQFTFRSTSTMWLPSLIWIFLFMTPSTADFGLPVPIPDLRSSISSAIGFGVAPINKILEEIKAINVTSMGYNFKSVIRTWYDVMADLCSLQNKTLTVLTKAIEDQSSGSRTVFDEFAENMNRSREQVIANRGLFPKEYHAVAGKPKMATLNMNREILIIDIDTLRMVVSELDYLITKEQRKTTITADNIKRIVTGSITKEIIKGVTSIMSYVGKLKDLAFSSLQSFVRGVNNTYNSIEQVNKMTAQLDTLLRVVENRTDKVESYTSEIVKSLNQTFQLAYKVPNKTGLLENAKTISRFLSDFTEYANHLYETTTAFKEFYDKDITVRLYFFSSSIEDAIRSGLEEAAFQMFKNNSFAEKCDQQHPVFDETLPKVIKLMESCIQTQLAYLPTIVQTFEELVQSINSTMLEPILDLQTCITKLGQKLCYKAFVTAYLGGNVNATLTSRVNSMVNKVYTITTKELLSASSRVETCATSKLVLPSIKYMLVKRLACYISGK